nr:hypothetical protein [Nesterenkonia sp. PF2B19]
MGVHESGQHHRALQVDDLLAGGEIGMQSGGLSDGGHAFATDQHGVAAGLTDAG